MMTGTIRLKTTTKDRRRAYTMAKNKCIDSQQRMVETGEKQREGKQENNQPSQKKKELESIELLINIQLQVCE